MSENINELNQILSSILYDKYANLRPDTLKKGITCCKILIDNNLIGGSINGR